MSNKLGIAAAIAVIIASCTTQNAEPTADAVAAPPQDEIAKMPVNAEKDEGLVSGLPYARGKSFASLDEYLAHLEKNGAIDLPYWREIRPGVYEWTVRMPGAQSEIATRAELMERYGFTK